MKLNFNKIMIVTIAVAFVTFNIYDFFRCKREHLSEYKFIIGKIEIGSQKLMQFYNKDGVRQHLYNYRIISDMDVVVGDSIYKGPCAEFLKVYRKDANGKYKENLSLVSTSLAQREWFCN
jgi:hypothetical protein